MIDVNKLAAAAIGTGFTVTASRTAVEFVYDDNAFLRLKVGLRGLTMGKLLDKLDDWYLATTNITDDPDVENDLHCLCLSVAVLSERLDGTVHVD